MKNFTTICTGIFSSTVELFTLKFVVGIFRHTFQTSKFVFRFVVTDQSILNRIIAYEVDMQEKLKNLLEMEDLQVWRLSAPAAPLSTQQHDEAEAAVAAWRAKVDALWPSLSINMSIQAPFNPEDEDEEDMYEEDQELRRRMTEQLMLKSKGIGAVVGRG